MKKLMVICLVSLAITNVVLADTFSVGDNQFTIDFVNISGDASSANGTDISQPFYNSYYYKTFTDPSNNYRMGTYEITNDQWNKFTNIYGVPTGSASNAYDRDSAVSWHEAAQFANYLNISTDHQAAYKFTGTQGQSDYTFAVWESGDAGYDSSNPFRNSNAYYFLPTEDEWVKAAYWNGTNLQEYATKLGETLYQGDSSNGGWNYSDDNGNDDGPDGPDWGPWGVGSGSEELNGTFDMMGNLWEWTEGPLHSLDYLSDSTRCIRGGSWCSMDGQAFGLELSSRYQCDPIAESVDFISFRVASVPEPCSLALLGLGGLTIMRKRRVK